MYQPWLNEPDQVDFVDEKTGYACAMRRGPMGHWCGYVAVPADHQWYGKECDHEQPMPKGWLERSMATIEELGSINVFCAGLADNVEESPRIGLLVRCHGGITFAEDGTYIGLEPGWYFGFDCAHSGDYCPGLSYHYNKGDIYRDERYVRETLAKMCQDLYRFTIPLQTAP